MASLQETKRRTISVQTTRKITKAMQLVATAKLSRSKGHLDSIQEYYKSVYDTFQDLLTNVKDVKNIFPKPTTESKLYIIITSDLGLCGGYNSNALKLLKSEIKTGDKVIVIGGKGISHLKAAHIDLLKGYPHAGDKPDYQMASDIGKVAIAEFFTGDVSMVNLIYTKYINSVTFEAVNMQLLPIQPSVQEGISSTSAIQAVTEFEPSPEIVLKNSIPLYISAIIFGASVESKVSEMSSRRTAMESATDNADELIKNLKIEYNRARQAAITQQISEIVSGAEAL